LPPETSSQDLRVEERYSRLRRRLAHYLLLQAYTFMETSGEGEVPAAMRKLTEKSAELKVQRMKDRPPNEYAEALGEDLATNMGVAFDSSYFVERDGGSSKVVLDECGCITSVIQGSAEFSLDPHLCRTIFCGSCLGGYREATEILGLRFKGKLTDSGCMMSFKQTK